MLADPMARRLEDLSEDAGMQEEEGAEKISVMWVLAHIALLTIGELHVQPVRLAPPQLDLQQIPEGLLFIFDPTDFVCLTHYLNGA